MPTGCSPWVLFLWLHAINRYHLVEGSFITLKILRSIHSWSVTPKQAINIQKNLASRVVRTGRLRKVTLVAGADLAFSPDKSCCMAGVVIWDMRTDEVIEQHVVRRQTRFPYVPGLLSFREAPALLSALRKIRHEPDVFLFDGQGYAHPRRFGLACHVGLWIDRPSIGCAKSLLIGDGKAPGRSKGSMSPLMHQGERIGMALRTRDGIKPLYVSVGHRLSLETSVEIALCCCTKYRLPQPTRLADQLVSCERARLQTAVS